MSDVEKSQRREAAQFKARHGQRGQSKWWLAVARSQSRRLRALDDRANRRTQPDDVQPPNCTRQ